MLAFDGYAVSDAGSWGGVNEDHVLMDTGAGLFAVADGMGGRPGGETASRLAVETFARLVAQVDRTERDHDRLRKIADETNRAVRTLGESDVALSGTGTTFSALLLDASGGTVVHVGDSRILRFRNGALTQLTSDHTVEAEYRRHASAAAEPLNPRIGSMLARALGAQETVDPEILDVDLRSGDVFLLATDGVAKVLAPAALESLLGSGDGGESAEAICVRLIHAVRARNPVDDATVGVVTVCEAGSPSIVAA